MTVEEAIAKVTRLLDDQIDRRLQALEARIRADQAATGPEDEDALDLPPDPDAPWQRITVEEIIERQRAAWDVWRRQTLADLTTELVAAATEPW